MKIYFENTLTQAQRYNLLQRPSPYNQIVENVIKDLCLDVKRRGDVALCEYTKRFDKIDLQLLQISKEEFLEAKNLVQPEFISALRVAIDNISKFHEQQRCSTSRISTMEGIVCWRESRPIESVGLYVPAGTAPLPSTGTNAWHTSEACEMSKNRVVLTTNNKREYRSIDTCSIRNNRY